MDRKFLFCFSAADKNSVLAIQNNDEILVFPSGTQKIADYQHQKNEKIRKVILPNTVKSIGKSAFYECTNLEEITLPDGLEIIEEKAFANCKKLRRVYVPDSVKHIGSCAFHSCERLEQINIPDTVVTIGDISFYGTPFLKRHTSYPLYIGKHLLQYADIGEERDRVLEASVAQGTKTINGDGLCWLTNATRINLPEGLVGIAPLSIVGCYKLRYIDLPDSLTHIYGNAFRYSRNLERVNVSEKNKTFKSVNGVLYNKDMTEILLVPEGIKTKEFVVPHGVKRIGEHAFEYCNNIENVFLPDTLTEIKKDAFFACDAIKKITVPNGVTTIGKSAFFGCKNLKTLHIPDTVSKIGSIIINSNYNTTIVCKKDSPIAEYVLENKYKHRYV